MQPVVGSHGRQLWRSCAQDLCQGCPLPLSPVQGRGCSSSSLKEQPFSNALPQHKIQSLNVEEEGRTSTSPELWGTPNTVSSFLMGTDTLQHVRSQAMKGGRGPPSNASGEVRDRRGIPGMLYRPARFLSPADAGCSSDARQGCTGGHTRAARPCACKRPEPQKVRGRTATGISREVGCAQARTRGSSWTVAATVRACMACGLFLLTVSAETTCPHANSLDGLTAASYTITASDAGGSIKNGTVNLNDFTFDSPHEITQRHLTSSSTGISVNVRCAHVTGFGCDGKQALQDGTVCAQEGSTCTCATPFVRFGTSENNLWSGWKAISDGLSGGSVLCHASYLSFGDPAPGRTKLCECSPQDYGNRTEFSTCLSTYGVQCDEWSLEQSKVQLHECTRPSNCVALLVCAPMLACLMHFVISVCWLRGPGCRRGFRDRRLQCYTSFDLFRLQLQRLGHSISGIQEQVTLRVARAPL